LVNYAVIFGPDQLIKRGATNRQAAVLVHELFSCPSGEIYGYQGNSHTAKQIANWLRRRYHNSGRLRRLTDEEWASYYPQTWII